MKLVKQTRLAFVEGKSDKVYEVDLCEVGADQFVVNFRYGKRGGALKDGSKTPAPVKRGEADRVFAKLVQSKLDTGYLDEATPRPAPTVAAPTTPAPGTAATATAGDARRQQILTRLAATGSERRWFRSRDGGSTWPLERAIWRAGELRLREAEPLLLRLIGTATSTEVAGGGKGMRDYCIAWALGRCGSAASLEALTRLYGDARQPAQVRRIAGEALMLLGDDATTAEFKAHVAARLPAPLAALAAGADPAAFQAALLAFPLATHADVLYQVYLADGPTTRPGLLHFLRHAPLVAAITRDLRAIWKAAELRGDARVFGLLGYRLATLRNAANQPVAAFTPATRGYLRARTWRVLRRLGQAGDPDYVKLAAGLLLPYTDADGGEPRTSTHDGGRTRYDRFASHLTFNHILYGTSARYELRRNRRAWQMRRPYRDVAPAEREEAFPALWERNPAPLMQLCAESACTPVHEFAAKALAACPAFLAELDRDDVLLLLGRPYQATARLGFGIAEARFTAAQPDWELVAAVATCAHAPGRARAITWIDAQRGAAVADSALLAALVLAGYADTRQFARRLLRATPLAATVGQALMGRLVAGLLALPADGARAGDAAAIADDTAQTIAAALGPHLATVTVAVIRDLLAHPLAGVQELGAELLLRHDARSGLIPVDLLVTVLHSPHGNVRALGLRLVAELPDDVLVTMDALLVRMCADGNADIRNAARPLVARVIARDPAARDHIVAGLIEALVRRRLPDDVPQHVLRLLLDDLAAGHPAIDAATVLRLLASASPHAQELGGRLLVTNVAPDQLTLEQIVDLASHEVLTVRAAAWAMYERDVPRVRADLARAVRIVDARWDDSRRWAFAFFRRDEFGPADFTADVLLGVIDSVRADVQGFGRELLNRHFDEADGPALLVRLAEHPGTPVQLFATNYLARFATGRLDRLEALVPYFTSVLSRVNQGRVAKQRVWRFLTAEGARDEAAARVVMPLVFRIAATISIEGRAAAIEAMMTIHRAWPDVPLPITVRAVAVRPAPPRMARSAGGR
ncbi:MAG: hypothetical protein R3B06_11585 [Kofleriaceae bacterium]